jgi:uncharacterized membrane protein (DUF106 family)
MFALAGKYFTVYALSMLKFIFGPTMGTTFGFHWTVTAIITVAGMMTSVVLFSLMGNKAKNWIMKRFQRNRRLFTPRNRKTVNIWRKYGLTGVAFLTPILLTPIGGTILAVSFGEAKGKIFLYMLCSAVFWGILMSVIAHYFGDWVREVLNLS